MEGRLTCPNEIHQKMEDFHKERGQGRFQLKERMERARVAHPDDAVAQDVDLATLADDKDREEEFTVDGKSVVASEPMQAKEGKV